MCPRPKSKTTALAAIKRARGSLKRKPGQKPFAQEWAEYKAREIALENRLDRRLRAPR